MTLQTEAGSHAGNTHRSVIPVSKGLVRRGLSSYLNPIMSLSKPLAATVPDGKETDQTFKKPEACNSGTTKGDLPNAPETESGHPILRRVNPPNTLGVSKYGTITRKSKGSGTVWVPPIVDDDYLPPPSPARHVPPEEGTGLEAPPGSPVDTPPASPKLQVPPQERLLGEGRKRTKRTRETNLMSPKPKESQ